MFRVLTPHERQAKASRRQAREVSLIGRSGCVAIESP
jgi:hypothetical protein